MAEVTEVVTEVVTVVEVVVALSLVVALNQEEVPSLVVPLRQAVPSPEVTLKQVVISLRAVLNQVVEVLSLQTTETHLSLTQRYPQKRPQKLTLRHMWEKE